MSSNYLTLNISSKIDRKLKSLKRNLKYIKIHHGTHSKTLAPNTFPLTKGHHHQTRDKIRLRTDVLNVTHVIGNEAISVKTIFFFHCEIDKSESDKDEEVGTISSYDEETNNEHSRNIHELGNPNANPTLLLQ
jgi:hypothetical protein